MREQAGCKKGGEQRSLALLSLYSPPPLYQS